jgi:hypothetical protein
MADTSTQVEGEQDFVLDLQKLHGDARPLIVKAANGQRYECRGRDALGPAEIVLADKVMRRLNAIGQEVEAADELSPAQDARLRSMVHDMIRVVSPELAEQHLCFADEFAIVSWYGEQTTKTAGEPKNGDGASA